MLNRFYSSFLRCVDIWNRSFAESVSNNYYCIPKMLFFAFLFATFGIKFVKTSTFGKNWKCIRFLDVFLATQCFLPTYHRGVSNAAPIAELWNVSPFDCLTYCIVNAGKTGVSFIFCNSLLEGADDVINFLRMDVLRLYTIDISPLVNYTLTTELLTEQK